MKHWIQWVADKFWASVERAEGDGCWLWKGRVTEDGYGVMWWRSSRTYAHRASWTLANGDIPPGRHVLHRCDNPPCANPAHLFLGDQASNVADMRAKGRHAHGPKHAAIIAAAQQSLGINPGVYAKRGVESHLAKLTEDDVRLIRSAEGTSIQLAPIFGVSSSAIRDIRRRKTWRHVE